MVGHNSPLSDEKQLVVRRGRVDSVDLYEVKENELDLLEKGSPATLQLNFAIFLFSIALTAIVALATTTFKWPIVETIFTFVAVVGVLLGSYLIISWWRTRSSILEVIETIKNRIVEEPVSNTADLSAKPKDSGAPDAPKG